jgi:hypothetical protein
MTTLNQTIKELLTMKISILSLMKLKTFRGIMYLMDHLHYRLNFGLDKYFITA